MVTIISQGFFYWSVVGARLTLSEEWGVAVHRYTI